MIKIEPYINFDNQCEDAFNFYHKVFKCEQPTFKRFSEVPAQEGMPAVPEKDLNKIMHVCMPITKEFHLMGSDTSEVFGKLPTVGNNINISFLSDNLEKAQDIFDAFAAEGEVTMPFQDTFWGARFGCVIDQFGINWMISYSTERK